MWKTFWATQQRFFKLLCVSLKVKMLPVSPQVVELLCITSCAAALLSARCPDPHLLSIVTMCTAGMQIPVVVQEAKAALAAGHCVVIGLQATGEAAAQVQLLSSNRPLVLARRCRRQPAGICGQGRSALLHTMHPL